MVFNTSFFLSGAMKDVGSDMLGLWFITLKVDVNYSSKPFYQINDNSPVVIPSMAVKKTKTPENTPSMAHKGLKILILRKWVREAGRVFTGGRPLDRTFEVPDWNLK